MKVATVWVALMVESVVLLGAAGMAVKWVRQSPSSAFDQRAEPAGVLAEQPA